MVHWSGERTTNKWRKTELINEVTLVGRLGKTPVIRQTKSGHQVANLVLATNRKWTKNDGTQMEDTEWHDVVFWGKQAEIVEKYCDKGTLLYVKGRIATRKWQGDDGMDRYRTEVIGQFLQLMPGGSRREATKSDYDEFEDDSEVDAGFDDLPF